MNVQVIHKSLLKFRGAITVVETEHIIQALHRIESRQALIFEKLEEMDARMNTNQDQWVDGLEVQKILGISRATVFRMNKSGVLTPHRVGGRSYYRLSEIFKLRNRFLK